ncbi:MAG: hydrogenase maturation protease, partial [Calditrichia bacterium]|nr:hydrogenase maturation protease [Calditrichia bacterium]
IFLVDATIDGQKLGTITRLTPRFSSDYPRTLTAHDIGLKDLIDSFHLLGKVPEVILYAVSIISPNQVSLELSPELEETIPKIAYQILLETSKDIKLVT